VNRVHRKGLAVVTAFVQRVDWVLGLTKSLMPPPKFEPEIVWKLLAADREWQQSAQSFVEESEACVREILTPRAKLFENYRELIRNHGGQWPHSEKTLQQIRDAGYEHKPRKSALPERSLS
jgi:hypothetical protein